MARKKRHEQKPDKKMLRRTLWLMLVCGIAAFLVLAARLFVLQILQHDELETAAVEQQTRESTVQANRGTIYDRNGNVLAMSASVDNVFISPNEIAEKEQDIELIARGLSVILDVDYEDIIEKSKDTESYYKTIKLKVEEEVANEVRAFISENDIEGVYLESTTKRYYPYSTLACHVIGFVGTENTGLEGLEAGYNSYLMGTDGRVVRLKNGWGSDMLFTDFEEYYDAEDGNNATLTIDVPVQYIVEKYLQQAVSDNDALNGGACIAMDPDTGEILAMASYGNYDLNDFMTLPIDVQSEIDLITDETEREEAEGAALAKQWRNKALSDTYEPGSVFKIITLAMGLEEGVITEGDHFYCGGSQEVIGRDPVNCWKRTGHGDQSLAESAQNSCNCAFVQIGEKVGSETFYEYISAFGLFDETGIDLSGEGRSLWWSDEVFNDPYNHAQLAAASFGQTFTVTPIQMITAVSAVCNGGYLMKPYVVSSIEDSNGNAVMVNEPTVVRQVISSETSDTVNAILETVVSEGTGSNAYVAGYRIAGKTGTSEKVTENLSADYKSYIVSFCGYAPANDPEIVVLLLLDTPSNETGRAISGGNMAAPVVGNILSEILKYMGYEPEYTEEELEAIDVWVPDLIGWNEPDATGALNYEGLDYEFIGNGDKVVAQLPAPYSTVAVGSKIILYLEDPDTLGGNDDAETGEEGTEGEEGTDAENGEEGTEGEEGTDTQQDDDLVSVPNIVDLPYPAARDKLETSGLYVTYVSGSTENGVVGVQYTEAGTMVPRGTVIEVALVDSENSGEGAEYFE